MDSQITKKFMFFFPKCECEKPIIYHLVKDYNLIVNVFRASVTPNEEGYLVLDITGTEKDIEKAVEFVKTFKVRISSTIRGLNWQNEQCTHCGACLTQCPTAALYVKDPSTREIAFDETKCIECLACITACPFGACVSVF